MTLQSVSQVNNKLSNPFASTGVVTLSFIHGDRAAHPLSCWNCCLWTILDLKMPTTLSFTVHSLALVFRREGKERRLCAKGAAFFLQMRHIQVKNAINQMKDEIRNSSRVSIHQAVSTTASVPGSLIMPEWRGMICLHKEAVWSLEMAMFDCDGPRTQVTEIKIQFKDTKIMLFSYCSPAAGHRPRLVSYSCLLFI